MLASDVRLDIEGTGKRMRHVKMRPGGPVNEEALSRLIASAYVDIRIRLGVSG